MRTQSRQTLAFFYYMQSPLKRFLPVLAALCVVMFLGGVAFHLLYVDEHGQPLTLARSLYITYCLIFMEHLLPFPNHWFLEILYVLLPPLGLVVILDGVVRFSYQILRRDETSREWVSAMCKTLDDHVILVGLGKLGLRVLQQLLALGEKVAVMEKDPLCPNLAFARKHGIPVVIGTGREEGILDNLNGQQAKSIILATDDDLANLELALDARKLRPGIRVVLRMFDQELASKVRESFHVDLAFSTSELSAPLFATASFDKSIVNAFYVGKQLLVVAELTVRPGSKLVDRQVGELRSRDNVFVLRHRRSSEKDAFCPEDDVKLAAGDRLTVQTDPKQLARVHEWNHEQTL